MTYQMLQHIPLKSAYLCQDCNSVGNNSRQCPACASRVLLGLASILDRESAGQMTEREASRPYLKLVA